MKRVDDPLFLFIAQTDHFAESTYTLASPNSFNTHTIVYGFERD